MSILDSCWKAAELSQRRTPAGCAYVYIHTSEQIPVEDLLGAIVHNREVAKTDLPCAGRHLLLAP